MCFGFEFETKFYFCDTFVASGFLLLKRGSKPEGAAAAFFWFPFLAGTALVPVAVFPSALGFDVLRPRFINAVNSYMSILPAKPGVVFFIFSKLSVL